MILRSQIDHIIVTAADLESGIAFVREKLGVSPQPGGEHPAMGTHNRLLRLGESLYLEVIASNPDAPEPGRPRWFGLDLLSSDAEPALSSWVVRVADIKAATAAASEALGEIKPMRRGDLEWLITIPDDGRVPLAGVAPALIEWGTNRHPATGLEDVGLRLLELEIFHPEPERVKRLLTSIELEGPIAVSPLSKGKGAHLRTVIKTQQGAVELPPAWSRL